MTDKTTNKKWYKSHYRLLLLLVPVWLLISCQAEKLFYYPDNYDYGTSPDRDNLPFEFVEFNSYDGTKLTGWFIPAQVASPELAQGTVIHVHGNAGNMTAHWPFVSWLPARGFNVFMFDYRGYAQSEGEPSQKGLLEDTQSAFDYVRSRPDVDAERLVVFAQSLGGNNAVAAIGRGNRAGINAMVVDSTFYSYASVANDKLMGAGLFYFSTYSAAGYIDQMDMPLLFIHNTGDRVIPYHHSPRLYDKAKQPKTLITVQGGDHLSATVGADNQQYRDQIVEFYNAALADNHTKK